MTTTTMMTKTTPTTATQTAAKAKKKAHTEMCKCMKKVNQMNFVSGYKHICTHVTYLCENDE